MVAEDKNIYYCIGCNKIHPKGKFYKSFNSINKNGIYPFCKDFIKKEVYMNGKDINLEKFQDLLSQMDAPFIQEIWDSSLNDKNETVGMYFKNINMMQYRGMGWKHSSFGDDGSIVKDNNITTKEKYLKEEDYILSDSQITPEMLLRWGHNYTNLQISYLENFYQDMHITHTIVTPQHEKALILICKLQLKMDNFLEADDMVGFSKVHGEYQKLLTSSGLRPIDKIGGAEASGIRSFSQIFEEIEKEGFIKPAPLKENQDIVDKTIQYIMNYTLKLLNQQVLTEPPFDTPKVDEEVDMDG